MKAGLKTSETWIAVIPGIAILTEALATDASDLVRAACALGVAMLGVAYLWSRTRVKEADREAA